MHKVTLPVSNIKAVIFDMDGTMVDNNAYHKKAWQSFLKARGISLTDQEFQEKLSGKKNDKILEFVLQKKPDAHEVRLLSEEKEALYRELYKDEIAEVQGLSELIQNLRSKNLKVAIATTALYENREFVLRSLELHGQFDVILGDEHVTNGKPHPEIYLETANQLSVAPDECLVFEDSPPGIASAKAAGMQVVGVLSSHTPEELSDAGFLVRHFDDIIL